MGSRGKSAKSKFKPKEKDKEIPGESAMSPSGNNGGLGLG